MCLVHKFKACINLLSGFVEKEAASFYLFIFIALLLSLNIGKYVSVYFLMLLVCQFFFGSLNLSMSAHGHLLSA